MQVGHLVSPGVMATRAAHELAVQHTTHGNPAVRFCRKFWTMKNLRRKFPVTQWIKRYSVADLTGDLVAGLTLGVTVLPQGLANGVLAGLPPQYGLYTAFMGCFVYFLLGTAKDINLGPTAIMSLMVEKLGNSPLEKDPTYAVLLTLGCGIIQTLTGLFHLGFLVQFISHAVITGFTAAAAITIGVGQVSKLLGLRKVSNSFFEGTYDTFSKIQETNLYDMAVGLTGIALLISMKKFKELVIDPRLKGTAATAKALSIKGADEATSRGKQQSRCHCLPLVARRLALHALWMLCTARNAVVVLLAAIVAAMLWTLHGVPLFTPTAEAVRGLPPFRLPDFTVSGMVGNVTTERSVGEVFQDLSHGFVIIALVGILEQIAIGKSFAAKNNYRIDPNQEIFAMGVANFFGAFVSSFPVTASFSRSAVNSATGVRTPAGGLVTGAVVLLALAVLTPYFVYVPQAALSAVIICAVMDMIDYEHVVMLWRVKRWDLVPFAFTFLPSFPLGIEYGILIGVSVSTMMLMYPLARPGLTISYTTLSSAEKDTADEAQPRFALQLDTAAIKPANGGGSTLLLDTASKPANGSYALQLQDDSSCSDVHHVATIQPDQGLKFAGAEYIYDKLIKHGPFGDPPRHVVLDCSHFSGFDSGTVQAIVAVADVFKKHCLEFVLAAVPADLDSALIRYKCKNLLRAEDIDRAFLMILYPAKCQAAMTESQSIDDNAICLDNIEIIPRNHGVDCSGVSKGMTSGASAVTDRESQLPTTDSAALLLPEGPGGGSLDDSDI